MARGKKPPKNDDDSQDPQPKGPGGPINPPPGDKD